VNRHDDEIASKESSTLSFDLKVAYQEVVGATGAKETAVAGAKLFGKGLFNTVLGFGKAAKKKLADLAELKGRLSALDDAALTRLCQKGTADEKMVASTILKTRQGAE